MEERHRPHCASYLILKKDEKILLMQRQNTGFRDGQYSLVAGHVDKGENFREAMIREAEEEVGIELEKADLETTTVMHRRSDGAIYIDLFFLAEEWEGEPTNEEPEKCAELIWREPDDLPDNTIDYVEKVIDEMEEGLEYQEIGWQR